MSLNPFADLHESESEDATIQQTEIPAIQSQNIIQLKANQPNLCKNLLDLSKLIDKLIETPKNDTKCFFYHFYDFETCDLSEYEKFMEERSNCYKEFNDSEFVNEISNAVSVFEPLEIRPLVEKCVEFFTKGKKFCHGTMFLLGLIVSQRPDLITPDLFKFERLSFLKCAPLFSWIIFKSLQSDKITHLDPLLSHQLLDIFLDDMMSVKEESNAVAVCGAHLIVTALERQKITRVSAYHLAHLVKISERQSNPRDCHVGHVLMPIMEELSTIDKKALAEQLMAVFPDAPECATDIFIREVSKKGSVTFVDGWVEAHATNREVSMKYLNATAGKIPQKILCKFPKKDLRNGSNRIKLAVIRVELTNTSFRFCSVVLLYLLILYFYRKKGKNFHLWWN